MLLRYHDELATAIRHSGLTSAQQPQPCLVIGVAASASSRDHSELWTPPTTLEMPEVQAAGGGAATVSTGYDEHRARTPPPDLPSLLLDSRIVYLGMPVSELHSCMAAALLMHLCCFLMPALSLSTAFTRTDCKLIECSHALIASDEVHFNVGQAGEQAFVLGSGMRAARDMFSRANAQH